MTTAYTSGDSCIHYRGSIIQSHVIIGIGFYERNPTLRIRSIIVEAIELLVVWLAPRAIHYVNGLGYQTTMRIILGIIRGSSRNSQAHTVNKFINRYDQVSIAMRQGKIFLIISFEVFTYAL